jgi:hypothetical protein
VGDLHNPAADDRRSFASDLCPPWVCRRGWAGGRSRAVDRSACRDSCCHPALGGRHLACSLHSDTACCRRDSVAGRHLRACRLPAHPGCCCAASCPCLARQPSAGRPRRQR